MLLSHNRNEALTLTTAWMNLVDVMLGERSRHRRQILSDSTHRRSLEESDPETGSIWWGHQLGVGLGSQCFMRIELQFGKMRTFWR